MGETLLFALLIAAFGSVFFQIGRGRKGRALDHSQPVPPGPVRAESVPVDSTRVEPSFSSKVVHPDPLQAEPIPPDPIRVESDYDAEEVAIESAPSPPHPMASAKMVKFLVRQGTECTVGFADAAGRDLVTRTGLGVMKGEYLRLMIDMETGQVLNWRRPSEEALQRFYDWQTA